MGFIIDLPLSRSSNGMFTVVDKLTNWVKLIPMVVGEGELSMLIVTHLFFNHIMHSFGVPHIVLYNWDSHFTSWFCTMLWELLGTRVSLSSAYHPESNGQIERVHQTVE